MMQYADDNDCIVITKDADFVDAFYLQQTPKKLWLLSTGNINNDELEHLVQANIAHIIELFADHHFIELNRTDIIAHT